MSWLNEWTRSTPVIHYGEVLVIVVAWGICATISKIAIEMLRTYRFNKRFKGK